MGGSCRGSGAAERWIWRTYQFWIKLLDKPPISKSDPSASVYSDQDLRVGLVLQHPTCLIPLGRVNASLVLNQHRGFNLKHLEVLGLVAPLLGLAWNEISDGSPKHHLCRRSPAVLHGVVPELHHGPHHLVGVQAAIVTHVVICGPPSVAISSGILKVVK